MKKTIKFLSLLLTFLIICSILTACGGNKKEQETNIKEPTTSVQETQKEEDKNITKEEAQEGDKQETSIDNTNQTKSKFIPEIIKFDKSILSFEETGSFDVNADIVQFTSTKKPTEAIVEQFYTANEFKNYLNQYSDIQDNTNDTIEISKDEFTYTHGMKFVVSSGFEKEFFFVGHPDMPELYEIDVDESYYDKATGNIYIVLVKEDLLKDECEGAKTSYGILYMNIDEDFIKENTVNKVYLVLPE